MTHISGKSFRQPATCILGRKSKQISLNLVEFAADFGHLELVLGINRGSDYQWYKEIESWVGSMAAVSLPKPCCIPRNEVINQSINASIVRVRVGLVRSQP